MENKVTEFFKNNNLPLAAIFSGQDTATVEKAAKVFGVKNGQIAKSLALKLKDRIGVLVAAGDARLDNRKFKAAFNCKAKMLSVEETAKETGFAVGGVCPFALPHGVSVYLDESLKQHDIVYPAAGTLDSSVEVEVAKIAEYTSGQWVDVCKEVEV